MTRAVEIVRDEGGRAEGLEALLFEAWAESGRKGSMPAGWRPFDPGRTVALAARTGGGPGRLDAYAALRPAEGMDTVEFFYVRRRARAPDGGPVQAALLERLLATARELGLTRIVYAGFGWWRAPFAPELAAGFERAGFRRFEGVFLARPIEPGGPAEVPPPPGYALADWTDDRFEEACALMLRSPEPRAIYWDMGLCRRSITGAGNPLPPLFRDGLGQLVLREADGSLAAFTLATPTGYVNHVYTDPADRGRGLARCMITRLLRAIARRGLLQATILTHDTNPRAIALYERLGFRVDFTFPQFHTRW